MDYNTGYTSFRIPPLTLQPLVENAVKHGTDLHIAIENIIKRLELMCNGTLTIAPGTAEVQ